MLKYIVILTLFLFSFFNAYSVINYFQSNAVEVGSAPAKIIKLQNSNNLLVLCYGIDIDFDNQFDEGEEKPSIWLIKNDGSNNFSAEKIAEFKNFFNFPLRPTIDNNNGILYIPTEGYIAKYDLNNLEIIDEEAIEIDAAGLDFIAGHLLISTNDENGAGKLIVLNLSNNQILQTINIGKNLQETYYYRGKDGISIAALTVGDYGMDNSTIYYGPINHMFDFDLKNSVVVGNTANHMIYTNGKLYVVVNGSHTVNEIDVNTNTVRTFYTGTTGWDGPRELAVKDNYLYLTTYSNDIRIINITTGILENIIPNEFNLQSEGITFIDERTFAVTGIFDQFYSPSNVLMFFTEDQPSYIFTPLKVGDKPVWTYYYKNKLHIICAGKDINNNGNEDSGDTKPSWWTVENGKPVKKMEFPFNSIKIPFNPAIDEQNGIMYIPHRNVIRSYDLDSFTWLDDNISNIDANSIDFAGGHLLIPKKYEDKPDSIVVLNLKNGMVLQKVYAGDEVIDVKYYPFVEDGKTKIGLAITTYIETLKSYVVLYGPIKHMQDFSLDNVELIEKPYRIHFSDNVLKIISKETGLIYNINVLDGEKEVLNFATNGEFGPSSLAVTDNEYLVSTYYGDVRSWDLLFKQLKNINFVDGKVEHINYINSIENLILASPLTIDNKPNDKIYVLNEIISSVNDNYIHYPNLSIYPNPAFNYLNIEFDNVDYSNVIYKIYNINGAVLSEGKINNLNNIINIDDLSNGNYFLQIIVDNNKYYTIPFIKNK